MEEKRVIALMSGTSCDSIDAGFCIVKPNKEVELLKGIKTWVLECTTDHATKGHVSLEEVIEWVQKIHPKRVYLTHMGAEWDYNELSKKLPKNIKPVYDNMVIKINS